MGKTHTHHLRKTCEVCGTVNTCRCTAPKQDVLGICFDCCEKAGIDFQTGLKIASVGKRVAGDVVLPPDSFEGMMNKPSVFLAGAIDMGKADDWQKKLIAVLEDVDCTILNPRRSDWDSTWVQSIDNPQFREQVEWELSGLDEANVVAVGLPAGSKAPISLMELGLHARDGKAIVWCPEGFWRKGNVDVVCERYGVPVLEDFDEFAGEVAERLRVVRLASRVGISHVALCKEGGMNRFDRIVEKMAAEAGVVFDVDTADDWGQRLHAGIKAPVVGVNKSTLGGPQHVSLLIMVSLQKKEDWSNGILENSTYFRLHLSNDGVLEMFSGNVRPMKPFRKTRVTSVEEAISKINRYIDTFPKA